MTKNLSDLSDVATINTLLPLLDQVLKDHPLPWRIRFQGNIGKFVGVYDVNGKLLAAYFEETAARALIEMASHRQQRAVNSTANIPKHADG